MENKKANCISLVVPCYNEEGNIPALYQRVREILSGYQLEFVFVDDCSTDGTLAVIEAELIEPYLYPEQGPDLGKNFAEAVIKRFAKGDNCGNLHG